jgi:hypothetical protein
MIQRIQSIYLLMTSVLSFPLLIGGIINFHEKAGSVLKITFKGLMRDTGIQNPELVEKLLPLTLVLILIPLISAITIFLFKKRGLQIKFASGLIILIILLILLLILYSYIALTRYSTDLSAGIIMALPALQLVLSVLAYRGIRKDDDLVKSYDRLR